MNEEQLKTIGADIICAHVGKDRDRLLDLACKLLKEAERLRRVVDQALWFADINPVDFDDEVLYCRSSMDQSPKPFKEVFPDLAAELRGVEDSQQ